LHDYENLVDLIQIIEFVFVYLTEIIQTAFHNLDVKTSNLII